MGMMAQSSPANSPRIVDKIDESQLTVLHGNTHPAAVAKNDLGRVSPDMPMTDLVLVLSRSAEKQAEFEKFVADQYDPNSTVFHQWLSPEQVGEKFGPSLTDIATVSNWLAGHGLSVSEVTKDRMSIRFSGTAAQVEEAFHTEIHNLQVKGVAHIGNMSDPQIPAALSPVVVGVKSLHNFFPHPLHRMGSQVMHDSATGKWKRVASTSVAGVTADATPAGRIVRPQYGGVDTNYGQFEDVGPYDFATIYNVLPLWNASTPIDGTGQTIAIAGTSDINPSDIKAFRTDFGLPTSNTANTPIRISGNSQPLTVCTSTSSSASCGINDLVENSLDVEWSGSVAKNAQIILVASYPASASDDNLYDSESYIVNHKIANNNTTVAPIMNVSYGECELGMGTAGNVQYYNLWQTAASEGIAVFVASGDSDAASCDDGMDSVTPYAAQYGLSVSGLASTPFNTAVGGTDLYWCPVTSSSCTSPAAQYWNTTNTIPSGATVGYNAKGYVPEVPWNDTCASPFGVQIAQEIASGIGISGVVDAETACNFAANPSYESEVSYYYGGYQMSYLVDIVGGSGGASNCVVNSSTSTSTGSCTTSATNTGTTSNPDTSASQGPQTVVNDGWPKPSWQTGVPGIPADGVRDIPDVSFFASDGFLGSAYLICVSEVSACTFSTNVEPFAQEVGGTSVATPAMAGVMALINQKAGVQGGSPAVNKELYALAAKQSYSNCSAESVTTSSSCSFNDIDAGKFTPGYNNATPCLAGSPNCTVSHSGDSIGILSGNYAGTGYDLATGLGSLNVANVVNNWTSAVIGTSAATVTVAPTPTSITVNQSLSVVVTVASATSGGTTPTGNVTLSSGTYTSGTQALSSGAYTFTVPAGSLSGGTDTLTVNYAGDSTYAANSGSASVTVTLLTPTVTATPSATSLNTNQSLVITGTVSGSGATPTGTVSVSNGSISLGAATLSSGSYSITITPNTFTASGTETLNVQYAGDTNYTSASVTPPVTVTETYVAVLPSTVTVTPATTTPDSGSPLMVTVTVSGTGATPTGTVTLAGDGFALMTATLANGIASFTIPANSLNTLTTTDTLTANYQGDANYAKGLGSADVTPTLSVYSVAATTPTAVAPGSSTTSSITVTSPTDYTGTVTFTSANCKLTTSPSGAVSLPGCALTGSGAVTMTNGVASGPVTFTVSTTGTTTALALLQRPGNGRGGVNGSVKDELVAAAAGFAKAHAKNAGWFQAAGGTALAALFLFLVPVRTRRWRKMFGALMILATVGLLTVGCGGSGGSTSGSSQGVPTVTVTASPTSVAVNAALTVQVSVAGSSGTPTGSVSLTGGGYTSPSQALTSGSTSFTIPANSFTSVGSVTLVANYSGDTNYESMNGSGTVTVNNVPTTAGTYVFTVTSTSSPTLATEPSTTFSVVVN
jgi:hypothetical protein